MTACQELYGHSVAHWQVDTIENYLSINRVALDPAQRPDYRGSVDLQGDRDAVGVHPQTVQVYGFLGDLLVARRFGEV